MNLAKLTPEKLKTQRKGKRYMSTLRQGLPSLDNSKPRIKIAALSKRLKLG